MIRIIFSKSPYRCARSDALSDKFVSSLSTVTFILLHRIDEFSSRFSRYCPIESDRGIGSGEDGRFIAFSKELCTLFSRKERNNPYPFRCTIVSISSLIRVMCYLVSQSNALYGIVIGNGEMQFSAKLLTMMLMFVATKSMISLKDVNYRWIADVYKKIYRKFKCR